MTAASPSHASHRCRSLLAATFVSLFALLCLCAPSLAAEQPSHPLMPGPGRLSLEFRPMKKPEEAKGKAVWNAGFLQRGVKLLNERLTLPADVAIAIRPGPSVDASPEPGKPLVLGYMNPSEIRPLFRFFGLLTPAGKKVIPPKNAKGKKMIDRAVHQLMVGVAFHEVGHVYTLQWPITTTSDDEAIADLFSSWVGIELLHDPEAVLMLANYRLGLADIFSQTHPGFAAWERGQGYQDLARLAAAGGPKWAAAARKLAPAGYISGDSSFAGFVGGPFAGLERALQPIAQVPLGGSNG